MKNGDMYSRILKVPQDKSFFLFGPRATGKTTWLQTVFTDGIKIDLLESELYSSLLASPGRLAELIPDHFDDWIIIDEVQRIPELLNEVHRLIEHMSLKFVLTGSSARKLRTKGVNLLAGRALTRFMHPLTARELGKDFSLTKSLLVGNLPSVYSETDPADYLAGYVRTYLREEVQQEGLTRNLQAFARFLEAASFSQASALNISEVARECNVNRKLAEEYFYIFFWLIGCRCLLNAPKDEWRSIPNFTCLMWEFTEQYVPKGLWIVPRKLKELPLKHYCFKNYEQLTICTDWDILFIIGALPMAGRLILSFMVKKGSLP